LLHPFAGSQFLQILFYKNQQQQRKKQLDVKTSDNSYSKGITKGFDRSGQESNILYFILSD
jgi:hypothetical protein